MSFLTFLEGLRTPFLDRIFTVFTLFGQEFLFLLVALIVFWCLDKYEGYYLMIVGFFGIIINQFLKMAFRIARPWVKDPNFTIVESAREGAAGYSFPSGHTQSAVGLYGGIARGSKKLWLRIVGIFFCFVVPISRMYLGVHTPLDVGISLIIGTALVLGLYPLVNRARNHRGTMIVLFCLLAVGCLCFSVYVFCYPFPAEVYSEINVANLNAAQQNAATMLGCIVGLTVVYLLDEYKIHFTVKAPLSIQLIKVIVGILLVLGVKEGLKQPLDALFCGNMVARSIRYFLTVVTAGSLWPYLFTKLVRKKVKN